MASDGFHTSSSRVIARSEDFSSKSALVYHEQITILKDKEEPYNPYEHRILEHPNSFLGAFLHIVKTSLGTGILAIPRAFKSAGLIVGFFGSILVGVICTHTIYVLVKASHKVCKRSNKPSLGFADTAEGVFSGGPKFIQGWSTFAKIFVEIGICLVHLSGNTVYIVFISVSLTKLFEVWYPEVSSWDHYIFKIMILGPLLILTQIRELKHLVPFSFIANVMLIIAFSITGYYIFSDISYVNIADRHMATSLTGIPSFFGTVLFAMEGIGAIMPVENSMKKPSFLGWNGVLNSGMAIIVILYTTIGFLGYYKFGEDIQVTITQNLPSDEIPAQIAQGAIATAVFFSFMIIFYISVDIIWSRLKLKVPASRHNIAQILLRIGLLLPLTGIAILGGEHLGALIDLVGAVFLSTLGLFVPALLDIIVDWDEGWGRFHWRLIKDLIIMISAVFGLASGSYYAILEIN